MVLLLPSRQHRNHRGRFQRGASGVGGGALRPVYCDVAGNRAVYVEPNVWVHHKL
jgi:hypothetical protein